MMSKERRKALMGSQTSRANKLALIAAYRAEGEDVTWGWEGEPMNSRLMVAIDGDILRRCKSYDEDVKPTLVDNGTRVAKQ